ncbi:MAG: polysaccharide pyruvyl transferase family protein [Candidatus Riflebacteria bacterium]|nr:polysaccharide pyruvyl transferase family protein [Candidatus Riflebacteria bacterium]
MNLFRRIPAFWLILLPLLIPGMLVAAWRCLFRNIAERQNVYVETVVDFEEIRQLAREEGWSLADLFAALHANGASSVAVSEDTLASLESEGKITVMNSKDIRKLSLNENLEFELPAGVRTIGALWVHSEFSELLDRIEQHLSWKIAPDRLMRIHRNLLLINKSSRGFRERVGLGFSSEYFQQAHDAGLGLVVRVFNYPGLTAEAAARIVNAIPSPASVSALLFAEEEMLGVRGELKAIIEQFRSRSYRVGWVEFNLQDGIEAYLKGLAASRPFVRVHSITRKEVDQVYNVPRSVARWVRAVKDRSMKMLYIRCFFQDDKRFIENLVKFNLDYINKTAQALELAGFKIAADDAQRLHDPRHLVGRMSRFEIVSIGLSLLLGVIILLRISFFGELSEKWCFVAFAAALAGFVLLTSQYFIALTGLAGAVAYSCIGVIWAMKGLEGDKKRSFWQILPGFVLKMVMPSVFGGLLIAGIYSEIEYLLKFEQFRGIKLAFILPLLFTGLWALRAYGRGIFSLLHRPVNPVGVFMLSALAAGTFLYLLRSGNATFLKPSEIEDMFRTFLEDTLIARPRNKEFLVGYPAALLFIFFYLRNKFTILPLLAIFMQMGQVSALNSLCHFHTPLHLSLLRIFNGLWTGVLVGLAVVLVVAVLRLLVMPGAEKEKSLLLIGYFGYGNLGDELLWQTFARRFLADFEAYRVVLLHSGRSVVENTARFSTVSRRDLWQILEEMFTCEAIVIPGGGVLQSATSCRSLIYYLALISLARLAGARIIMPCQGLGPFKPDGLLAGIVNSWLAAELKQAEYISLRDSDSAEVLNELTGISEAFVATDLAFLGDMIARSLSPGKTDKLRVFAILRGSATGAATLAADLLRMNEELENFELCPAALQPGEDDEIWCKAGWKGEIAYTTEPENVLADADLLVSMRLHGCVLATLSAVPWIGLAYDPKVSAFADSCRWKFCVNTAEADKNYLESKINQLFARRAEYADRLNRISGEKKRIAEEDYARIKQLFII